MKLLEFNAFYHILRVHVLNITSKSTLKLDQISNTKLVFAVSS